MTTHQVLLNPTDAELGVAIEENLFALFRAMATLPGGELVDDGGLSLHSAFPMNPMFKGAWAPRLAGDQVDAAIDGAIAWFEERDAPFAFFWTGPSTRPTDLGKRLATRGFPSMEEQTQLLAAGLEASAGGSPGMVGDLYAINEAALTSVPEDFTIEEVRDEAALDDFKRVLVESYGVPEPIAHAWVDATLAFGLGRSPWRLYLGRLAGKAIATTLLFNGGGVAGIFGVATLPEARGKGIGGAITLAPLLEARAEGYRHAVLFSSAMGIRAYERIGFRLIDAWIDRYMWRAG